MYELATLAKNRPSPDNEEQYREAYKKHFPNMPISDGLDISAVISKSGIYGHALMDKSDNRSRDDKYHIVFNFISDDVLQKHMK